MLIEATHDVSVQVAETGSKTSDATIVLPTTALGTHHYVLSYIFTEQSSYVQVNTDFHSFMERSNSSMTEKNETCLCSKTVQVTGISLLGTKGINLYNISINH